MPQGEGIVRGDAHQKLSGFGFIMGSLLIIIGSLLLPRASNLSDVQAMQKAYSEHATLLQACALLLTFGFLAVLIGMSGIYQSVTKAGSAWTRVGFYFHLVGVAFWMVGMSLDISYPAAILNWLKSPDASKEVAYSVVTVLSPVGIGRGTFPLNVIINWLALACLGIGMIQSAVYPRWLGWGGLLLGMTGVALGITMTFTGREALIDTFVVFMLLNLLWWLTCGIWVIRKAW